jgi:membrane protein YdbS with pleckstrin-like domain
MSPTTSLRARELAFRREVLDKTSALATAAFGLVAALAWNNAIQALFKRYYPAPDDPSAIVPLVAYALAITLVAVLVIIWIGRLAGRLKAQAEDEKART